MITANEIDKLILIDILYLGEVPRIIKRIEESEYPLFPWYKNMIIRFYNDQKTIKLDQIKTLKSFKTKL